MNILFEAIVSNPDDAVAAETGGADRFELCSALALGGLTPSLGTLRAVREVAAVPIMCIVRPREGGMNYSRGEYEVMLRDVEFLIEGGADGLVFGFLNTDGSLDIGRCREFLRHVERAAAGHTLETVFHRAFDVVADPDRALEQLVDLGVTRILTSGQAAEAEQGTDEIRRLIERADGRIQILPGGGIHPGNVEYILRETGADQVHMYLTRADQDLSTTGNPRIYFGAFVPESEVEVQRVDQESVRRVRAILDDLQ